MKKYFILLLFIGLSSSNAQNVGSSLNNLVNQVSMVENKNKKLINLSSNNKMLSQKMAKDAVFIANGVNANFYNAQLQNSSIIFNNFLARVYNGTSGFKKVTDVELRADLTEVIIEWLKFKSAVRKLYVNGKVDKASYEYILNNDEKLMRLSHKVMQTMMSKYRTNMQTNKSVEHALDISDRIKMLTQKMVKEKFLINKNVNLEKNTARLRGSISLFSHGLVGLKEGEMRRGLPPITDKSIQLKLLEIIKEWDSIKALYNTPTLNKAQLKQLIDYEAKMLKSSTELNVMIENTLEL
ncbi:MAG: type IV pili methyl-accepting chemotaxis transducer N-terminal domain-containing protein [Epsilonproteobacteria bacterium]|nr:type IV pili methyl-accepting chemotaxis transducer N-terminal domain-containing protein [Campylobacterota bacterium]